MTVITSDKKSFFCLKKKESYSRIQILKSFAAASDQLNIVFLKLKVKTNKKNWLIYLKIEKRNIKFNLKKLFSINFFSLLCFWFRYCIGAALFLGVSKFSNVRFDERLNFTRIDFAAFTVTYLRKKKKGKFR